MKTAMLVVLGTLLAGVALVWLASTLKAREFTYSGQTLVWNLSANQHGISLMVFRNVEEDDFYHHWTVPFWSIELVMLALGVALWLWRRHALRQWTGRGFPLDWPARNQNVS
jgi:hypothetical protein